MIPTNLSSQPNPQVPMTTFAVETTVFIPPHEYMQAMETSPVTTTQSYPDISFNACNIKQEPMSHDVCYYGNSNTRVSTVNGPNIGSYVSQAKARYSKVAVAGGHKPENRHIQNQEDAAIRGISQWLQQESASVH